MSNRSNAMMVIEELAETVSAIEVRDSNGFKGVFARQDIMEDDVIFSLNGTITAVPTMYTIQLARHQHLNFPHIRRENDDLDYCWQYLNHSCEPNGYMNIFERTFRASRNLRKGEQITFNYLTTESRMAVPFHCLCGSSRCFGYIQGRDFLTTAQLRIIASAGVQQDIPTAPLPVIQRVTGNLQNSFSSL
jgi:hypothetical protein